MDIDLVMRKFCDDSQFMGNVTPATIQRYKVYLEFFKRFAGLSKVEDITADNVRQLFVVGRSERNWKPRTFITVYMTLRSFFNWCVKHHYLPTNPILDIQLPRVEYSLPVKLTKQDSLKLLEIVYNYPYDYPFLRYRNHAIFAVFIFAGLRKSELLKLNLTDVDIQNLSLFVRQGKGRKDRIIPITFTLAQILSKYLQERKRLNKTCPEFFVSLNRNMGLQNNGLKLLVNSMRRVSNLNFTIHKLRHTFATLMLEGGCDIYSLSKMMGHSDIKTTTIYLSASVEHLRSQASKHPLNDIM
jgi:site-specific recombinase XerD